MLTERERLVVGTLAVDELDLGDAFGEPQRGLERKLAGQARFGQVVAAQVQLGQVALELGQEVLGAGLVVQLGAAAQVAESAAQAAAPGEHAAFLDAIGHGPLGLDAIALAHGCAPHEAVAALLNKGLSTTKRYLAAAEERIAQRVAIEPPEREDEVKS